MSQDFQTGDFLIFQLESGYGLLRILHIDNSMNEPIWHLAAYEDFFPDIETAEMRIRQKVHLPMNISHAAITDRAFLSTQSSRLINVPLTEAELKPYQDWLNGDKEIFDRSIRLMMGFR